MDESEHKERERFFGAAKLVAALTMLSRVLGLVRDRAIFAFGANRAMDTFWTAFRVPNTFRRLFGEGALSAAFVPVFTEVAETQGWDRARVVLANVTGALAVVLAGIVVLVEIGVAITLLFAPGVWDRTLLMQLILIVMPFVFTICLLALGSAALNCKGRFAYPAFAPIVLNVFLIAAALGAKRWFLGASWEGLFVLSAAVAAAGVVQLIGVVWMLRVVGLSVVPRLRPLLPEVRRMAKLLLPMLVPLGVVQFSSFFDSFYAWVMTGTEQAPTLEFFGLIIHKPLENGVVTHLYAAERMYNFPLGILAISVATVIFPLFSRYASRNDTPGLREVTNRALRLCGFLAIPAGVGLIILAGPAISAIYRSGEFHPDDVQQSAYILRIYCLGMWAYFCNHILLRAFFAQKDVRTPLLVSLIRAVVNVLLVATLIFTPLLAGAIGLATAVTSTANAFVLIWVLRRRWGRIGFGRITLSLIKTAIATAIMTGAICLTWRYAWPLLAHIDPRLAGDWTSDSLPAVTLLVLCILTGLITYLLASIILRCPELSELLGRKRTQT